MVTNLLFAMMYVGVGMASLPFNYFEGLIAAKIESSGSLA